MNGGGIILKKEQNSIHKQKPELKFILINEPPKKKIQEWLVAALIKEARGQ